MRLLLLCLTLAGSTPALAKEFEGVITGKSISSEPGKAYLDSIKMFLSSAGARVEFTLPASATGTAVGTQYIMVWRAADPDTAYILNPANKTYLKHDISKARQSAGAADAPTVEKLGKATVLGHSVERAKVTFSPTRTREIWVDTSLHFPSAALAAFGMERSTKNGTWAALDKAGIGGIPLKELSADGTSGWEATNVEQKSLPASLFQLPADYHEGKSSLDMLPPAQAEAMKKRLDAMTPEQRAKVEEMMKNAQH